MSGLPESVVVLDFETSGLSPQKGARAIEIGAVRITKGEITDRFQSLINPGFPISPFIESFTGISNKMLRSAPPAAPVMTDLAAYLGESPLVAHNALFDRKFLDFELGKIGKRRQREFCCSLLLARRIFPEAPDHKLATLIHYRHLPHDGAFHRALADAEMTARLWLDMTDVVSRRCSLPQIPFHAMCLLAKAKIPRVEETLQVIARTGGNL